MSILNIFTAKAPTIAGYEFDAVLEDTFEASVTLTGYTVELGARVSDHRIINPFRWRIVGAVSNTPLQLGITDFVGALTTGAGGVVSGVAGLSAGFLAGSEETRSSATLEFLLSLMTGQEPFDIDAGDIQLKNMIISDLTRTKDPSNEGGLIFEAQLQEYFTLETTLSKNQPSEDQLNADDPSASQASADKNLGEISGAPVVDATATAVAGVLG